MARHTISITLDVPDGMESAVHDAAYALHGAINELCGNEVRELNDAALHIHNATLYKRPPEVQEVMDTLRERARHKQQSYNIVSLAVSEITHALSEAERNHRMQQSGERQAA